MEEAQRACLNAERTPESRHAWEAIREAVKLREAAEAALEVFQVAALQAHWMMPVPEIDQLRKALDK
jgi:hypothetical protein